MEWVDVLGRIVSGENHNTEFSRNFGADKFAVGKAMCAFANGAGGLIILGVDDQGSIVGIDEGPMDVHEKLAGFLQNGCSSAVNARCGRYKHPNGWVHWIEVPKIRGFEPLRRGGRVYIRRERSNVEPSPRELQELYNTFGLVLSEEQVIPGTGIQDIDQASFKVFLHAQEIETEEEPQPRIEDDYRNAGVVTEFDGALRPTLYGLMVFGKSPQAYRQTGNFMIRCTAYAGTDQGTDVLLVGDGNGRLEEQVRGALAWIKSLGSNEIYFRLLRLNRPLIPEPAVREALANAVAHRDYAITGSPVLLEVFSDRVVVTSPGTLPNRMTVESVQTGCRIRSRNGSMAHAMMVARLAEKRGRGWPTMRRVMREFNGTEPELVNDDVGNFVEVTFRLKPKSDGFSAQ